MKPEDITAWALDELTPEERAQIEAALAGTPEAQQQAHHTKAFCDLLSKHLVDEDAALTAEQRAALQKLELPAADKVVPFAPEPAEPARMNGRAFHAKVAASGERMQTRSTPWMRMAALAACLMFTVVVIEQSRKAAEPSAGNPQVAAKDAPSGFPVTPAAPVPAKEKRGLPPPLPPADPLLASAPSVMKAAPVQEELSKLSPRTSTVKNKAGVITNSPAAAAAGKLVRGAGGVVALTTRAPDSEAPPPSLSPEGAAHNMNTGTIAVNGGGTLTLSGTNTYAGSATLGTSGGGPALPSAGLGNQSAAAARSDASKVSPGVTTASGTIVGLGDMSPPASSSLVAQKDVKREAVVSRGSTAAAATPAVTDDMGDLEGGRLQQLKEERSRYLLQYRPIPHLTAKDPTQQPGTARYARIVENPFVTVASQPLSTFSIDVDTASYANVRRFLNAGTLPPPDAVRLEELINYFPYDYEQPGKDEPFSVRVDMAEAPWSPQHRLARVAIKGRDVGTERPAANFVFLVDVSGSMSPPERLPLVKQSLEMLTEQLREDDHVSIVTYAGSCAVALESTAGKNKATILGVIRGLHSGGSTNGESGINMAYEQAAANFVKGGINRVILCTDGDFNVGVSSPHQLEKLIKEKAKGGTFLSVLGFGTDNLQDRTMMTLADHGNGNYAYIDSLGEARKVLVEQMLGTLITIAKDVKIQVEFNPAQVASYRLIGYEKRLLAAKDFNNDKKDAGEIGAGHTITALYEIIPAGLPLANGALAEVDTLRYQPKKPAESKELPAMGVKPPLEKMEGINDETMTVKLRYKEPDGQLSKLIEHPVHDGKKTLKDAPRDFRFATAVAGFGMLLRDSEHAEDFTFDAVRQLALSGKGEDALGYRGEFVQLVDKARGVKGR